MTIYIGKISTTGDTLEFIISKNADLQPNIKILVTPKEQAWLNAREDILMFVKTKAFQILVQNNSGGKFEDTEFVFKVLQ